jgi:hypothetical protein
VERERPQHTSGHQRAASSWLHTQACREDITPRCLARLRVRYRGRITAEMVQLQRCDMIHRVLDFPTLAALWERMIRCSTRSRHGREAAAAEAQKTVTDRFRSHARAYPPTIHIQTNPPPPPSPDPAGSGCVHLFAFCLFPAPLLRIVLLKPTRIAARHSPGRLNQRYARSITHLLLQQACQRITLAGAAAEACLPRRPILCVAIVRCSFINSILPRPLVLAYARSTRALFPPLPPSLSRLSICVSPVSHSSRASFSSLSLSVAGAASHLLGAWLDRVEQCREQHSHHAHCADGSVGYQSVRYLLLELDLGKQG